jgi:two-component system, chemotaxis family, sensor kinase CheA
VEWSTKEFKFMDFEFDKDELAELQSIFFEQAAEVLDSLSDLILNVERNPSDMESLRAIRRAVHTLKGDSTAFGFSEITKLAHLYEDALDKLHAQDKAAGREMIDLLLAGADALTALVNYYKNDGTLPDYTNLVARLAALQQNDVRTKESEVINIDPVGASDPDGDKKQEESRKGSQSMTLRVESERVDAAMNLVGELIIQRSMLSTLISELAAERGNDNLVRRLSEAVAVSGRTLSELQESVMRMRLVPIDQVFRRFPRVVRDASVKLNKPLRLDIIGGETEIDKSVVEVISDPLIHLIRNACDHGIESVDKRRESGKAEEGLILLKARRAGNQIAVEVEDNGGGIDPMRVVNKAAEKGVISLQDVEDWTDQQKIGLIFLPGFSTVDQVSDMSGRGIGMDVVKTTVDSLGGSITVSSILGHGTRFIIKLPLTMAIVRAMLFETCNRRFALPLDSIREITRLKQEETKTIDGHEVIRLRDRVLPLIRIDEVLGLRGTSMPLTNQRLFVFIVDLGDGRDVGLAVERLHGEQELVLKTVDDVLCKSIIVAGASILGDGEVVLILDPLEIVNEATRNLTVGA